MRMSVSVMVQNVGIIVAMGVLVAVGVRSGGDVLIPVDILASELSSLSFLITVVVAMLVAIAVSCVHSTMWVREIIHIMTA